MQNNVYKRNRQKTALVRLCIPAGCCARTIVKGDWYCLLSEINQSTTTDLDKLQLLALRFIGFGKKNRVFSQAYFCYRLHSYKNRNSEEKPLSLVLWDVHELCWTPSSPDKVKSSYKGCRFSPGVKSALLQLQTRSPRSGHVFTPLAPQNSSMCNVKGGSSPAEVVPRTQSLVQTPHRVRQMGSFPCQKHLTTLQAELQLQHFLAFPRCLATQTGFAVRPQGPPHRMHGAKERLEDWGALAENTP